MRPRPALVALSALSIVVAAVAAVTTASARPAATSAPIASAPRDPAADAKAVERVLRDWYDASERNDSAAWARPLLPEFFIIEDTTRLDRATLTRLLFGRPPAGTDRAAMRNFETVVVGDVAWTTFLNDEQYTPTGKPATPVRRYVETVIFRRVDGAWRMARYHATRINRSSRP